MKVRIRKEPDTDLEEQSRTYVIVRNEAARLDTERKELSKQLLAEMQEREIDKVPVRHEGTKYRIGIKTRETFTLDPDRLKKEIGAVRFNKLTTRVLDEKKVEKAIMEGDLDSTVVASCSSTSETPYIEVRKTGTYDEGS